MPPTSHRGFRPTKRDLYVACISAACTLLWAQFLATDNLGALLGPSHDDRHWEVNDNPELALPNLDLPPSPPKPPTPPHNPVQVSTKKPKPHSQIMPSTEIVAHGDGWTIFDNLYMFNGTLIVVSDEDPSSFPEPRMITSTGLPAENVEGNIEAREPTKLNYDVWSRRAAHVYFADRIYPISNVTFFINDPRQFIDHYYHFAAEYLLGAWRMYAGHLAPGVKPEDSKTGIAIGPRGETTLPDPTRVIFAHCKAAEWRDKIGYNQYFLHAAFPSVGLETEEDWNGRIAMTRGTPGAEDATDGQGVGAGGTARAFRFDRVLLTDRSASFRGPTTGYFTHRTAGAAYVSNRDIVSPFWWETIRRRVLGFSQVSKTVMDYAFETLSFERRKEIGLADVDDASLKPPIVVSYLSRQGWRRRLIEEDHKLLESSVRDLCKSKGWEFILFHPENYTLGEQLAIAARSTVMFGVHGNGLTHLIAMAPTSRSAVIEIFYPEGFARDYQWTAEGLGIKHFGVWNDTYFTSPHLPPVAYPEGFQGTQIPVHGPSVAKLIADRIEGRLDPDQSRPLGCPGDYCSYKPNGNP